MAEGAFKISMLIPNRFRNAAGAVDTEIRQAADRAGEDALRILRDSIRRKRSIATFALYNGASVRRLKRRGLSAWYQREIFFKGKAARYWRFANEGREPGKMPFSAWLYEWLDAVGLARTLAYVIARAIGEEGTEGAHFIEDALPRIRANTRKLAEAAKRRIVQRLNRG